MSIFPSCTKMNIQAHPLTTCERWFERASERANYTVTQAEAVPWPPACEWTEVEPAAFSKGLGLSGLRMWQETGTEQRDGTERGEKSRETWQTERTSKWHQHTLDCTLLVWYEAFSYQHSVIIYTKSDKMLHRELFLNCSLNISVRFISSHCAYVKS